MNFFVRAEFWFWFVVTRVAERALPRALLVSYLDFAIGRHKAMRRRFLQ